MTKLKFILENNRCIKKTKGIAYLNYTIWVLTGMNSVLDVGIQQQATAMGRREQRNKCLH